MATPKTTEKKAKVCPVTRSQFAKEAKPIIVVIDGTPMEAVAKEFSTGSLGWNINGKKSMKVGDTTVECQVGLNLTITHSKDAK